MAQISPPFRIALAAMVAVCALWFTVLKPKDPAPEAPLPTAPGATGLGNDVNAAKGAAATSDAANAKVQQATGGTPAATSAAPTATAKSAAAGATAKPNAKAAAARTADRTAPLLRALDAKKAVVMLFYNRAGIDDRAVRKAVAATDARHGRVVVKAIPVAQVGRYEAITRDARILESPTVLVIAPNRRARTIVGFTTTAEVDQAVGDALASAKPAAKK